MPASKLLDTFSAVCFGVRQRMQMINCFIDRNGRTHIKTHIEEYVGCNWAVTFQFFHVMFSWGRAGWEELYKVVMG